MSAMDVSNLTKQYMQKLFSDGRRFDGRGLLDLKDVSIEYGVSNKAEGSARVKIGKTEVIAGVKIDVSTPYPDSPDAGNLVVSGDLLPLASPRFEPGPPGFGGIEMPRLIDRLLRESGFIDFEALCIKKGEKVWTLYVDVYPLNDDGALIDAASLACVAALRTAMLPELNDEFKIDYEKKGKKNVPLDESILPLSFTFFKLGEALLLHPTREEEEACEAKVTFGASEWKGTLMINSCQKGWETTLSRADIDTIMDIVPQKYEEMNKKLNKLLK